MMVLLLLIVLLGDGAVVVCWWCWCWCWLRPSLAVVCSQVEVALTIVYTVIFHALMVMALWSYW